MAKLSSPAADGQRLRTLDREQWNEMFRAQKTTSSETALDPDGAYSGYVWALDIETGGLNADYAIILCAVFRPYPRGKPIVFRLDMSERDLLQAEGVMLKRIRKFWEDQVSLIVTWYGHKFDIPFLQARFIWHGLRPMDKKKSLDMYYTGKRGLKIHSLRLDSVNQLMRNRAVPQSPEKTRIDPQVWQEVIYGRRRKAMEYIVDHCLKDTEILINTMDDRVLGKLIPDRIARR